MDIDIVIIGLNSASTLKKCLEAASKTSYSKGQVHFFYVDGGSSDDSMSIAEKFPHFTLLKIADAHPSPSAGRNMGWEHGKSPLVQFLDSDTELHPQWLEKGSDLLQDPQLAAVSGYLKELNPDISIFNWFFGQEWNCRPGFCETFGGNVLMKRKVLEATKGYDSELVAGEDPELSRRIRQAGWKILQTDIPMATHDLHMQSLKKYLTRNYRAGYAYGLLFDRHDIWKPEVIRIVIRTLALFFFVALSLIYSVWFLIPAVICILFPRLFRVNAIAKNMNLTKEDARLYSWHASLVVIPQFIGILRYYLGKWFNKPLRNKRG